MDTCTLLHSLAYVHTCTAVIALVALMQIHILISHSKQLPLGVILKNENVGGEMIEIMEYCHQYVPSKTVDDNSHFIQQLLIGGDQLTCERARNSQRHRRDAAFAVERLEALEPVVEDWHTKMCLFQVRILFQYS